METVLEVFFRNIIKKIVNQDISHMLGKTLSIQVMEIQENSTVGLRYYLRGFLAFWVVECGGVLVHFDDSPHHHKDQVTSQRKKYIAVKRAKSAQNGFLVSHQSISLLSLSFSPRSRK